MNIQLQKIKLNQIQKIKYNIFHDIYKFILRFSKKNLNFDINLITPDESNSIENLENICDKLLEDIYVISFNNSNIDKSNNNKIIKEKDDGGLCSGEINLEEQKENINNSENNNNDDIEEEEHMDDSINLMDQVMKKFLIMNLIELI